MQLNEGLERLGAKEGRPGWTVEGEVFAQTAVEHIVLPSTLKRLEARTFFACKQLKTVEIQTGVEYVGKECFCFSKIEDITLPSTLREMGDDVFKYCTSLRTVYVQEGCAADVR